MLDKKKKYLRILGMKEKVKDFLEAVNNMPEKRIYFLAIDSRDDTVFSCVSFKTKYIENERSGIVEVALQRFISDVERNVT